MRIELVAHLARPGAVDVVRRAVDVLGAAGHACTLRIPEGVGSAAAPEDLAEHLAMMPGDDGQAAAVVTDLVISFGGDGTFLRAARIARAVDAPIIGVNVGRLGFLAEIDPQDLEPALAALTDGRFDIEHRSTLEVELRDADDAPIGAGWALNDVAVEKEARQRLVRLEVSIGATPFASMAADAVIVATSTGSTAYALSAGGPIVNPTLDAMLIAPVAPHSLFDRTVVTDLTDTVTVRVADDQDGALVSTDGMSPAVLGPGGVAIVRGGAQPVRVARLGGSEFFARVRRSFRLG
jgi:NAD+ kinase